MSFHLRKALRAVHLVDMFKDRQDFFDYYVSRHFPARVVMWIYGRIRGTPVTALIFAAFGMRYLLKNAYGRSARRKMMFPVDYVNERRAVLDFLENVGDELKVDSPVERREAILARLTLLGRSPVLLYRFYRYFRRYERKGTFLTCFRLSETLWHYVCAQDELRRTPARGIVTATNYSPTACALIAAARSRHIPVVYTFHAIIPYDAVMPKLEADLAFLYSKKAIDAFAVYGGVQAKRIQFFGLPGESVPMRMAGSIDEVETVGVFLTAYTIQDAFVSLIRDLSSYANVKRIVIRPHPLKDANPDMSFVPQFPKVEIDSSGRAPDTARKCQVVIAGSSSVHIEVLKSGTPSLYWEGFDTIGPDYYRFIRDGVVAEVKDISKIDWRAIQKFYGDGWTERFQELDCSYRRDAASLRKDMCTALDETLREFAIQSVTSTGKAALGIANGW